MLNLLLGQRDSKDFIYFGHYYFKNMQEPGWITNDFVKEMILDIDKCEVVNDNLVISPIFGSMSPKELSNGVLTMTCAYNRPEKTYNANSCGNNCVDWILKIANEKDITMMLNYRMNFRDKDFEIRILNDNSIVSTYEELSKKYDKYVGYKAVAYDEEELFGDDRQIWSDC